MIKRMVTSLIIMFIFSCLTVAQDSSDRPLQYELQINYPPLSIPKTVLQNATSLIDLNPHYKPSWVEKYISVDIQATVQGQSTTSTGADNLLTKAQKDLMDQADAGTPIAVKIQYWPANTLQHKEPKEMNFSISFDPEQPAIYPGGKEQLQQYLKQMAIDHIPETIFNRYALATVKFTVDEAGKVIDPTVFSSSENETVDTLLLETICNMPDWQPATYADGTKTKQDFAFMVGDMESCLVNMLNLRKR